MTIAAAAENQDPAAAGSTTATPIVVRHGDGSYPVHVEPGAIGRLAALVEQYLPSRRPFVIADATVAELHGSALGCFPTLTFPAGEASKTRESWARLTDELLALGAGRDSAILAVGGGVTGDLAGFVAATFHRGVSLLHVPTTLLAMVDSSIGGKTGVDTGAGKNLVGAFHPPVAVIADPGVLATLDDRNYRGGLAEAVKHGWMLDGGHFEWIEAGASLLGARDPERVVELIRRSVRIKAGVVAGDERDEGRRAILNAGHTIAHAIEQASGWTVPHGDAVAVGLVAEAAIAVELELLDREAARRLRALLAGFGLPVTVADLESTAEIPSARAVLQAARADKKNRADTNALRFALPAGIGRAHGSGDVWTVAVDPALVLGVLERQMPGAMERPPR